VRPNQSVDVIDYHPGRIEDAEIVILCHAQRSGLPSAGPSSKAGTPDHATATAPFRSRR